MVARTHTRMFAAIVTFAVTLSFLSSPVHARGPIIIIALFVPNQTVDRIMAGDGRDVGPGDFKADLLGYDNDLAKGLATLRLENSRYEFYFQRVELTATGPISIPTVLVYGRGQRTDELGRKHAFTFKATLQPHPYDPDCLIFDLDGANLTDRERFRFRFETEGTLRVR